MSGGFGKIVGALVSPLAAVTGILGGNKAKPAVVSTPAITTNPAAEALRNSDLLRQRRGALANTYAGGGAEAVTPGARMLFGQGG